MFYIIAKFQENRSTQFVLKCKSGKNFADFTIFSCVSSHISTLAHRNFTKLTQKLCLIMFYIIAKFQENLSKQFVLKCKSGKNFADFTIFSCVSSHISTLAHRNFTKLTQKLCLIMFYIIDKFQENLSTQFVLKCKSGKNFADFTIFSCVSSHISTLAHRNFTKLTQKLCLIMFYIIAKFQENRSTQFVLKCKSGKNCSSSPLKYLSPNSTFLRKEKKTTPFKKNSLWADYQTMEYQTMDYQTITVPICTKT